MTDSIAPARPDAEAPSPAARKGLGLVGWLRWFWRQLTSMRVALILLFLLALAAVPGSIFPQRGSNASGVDQYFTDHPGIAPWLDRLSLFDVYAAPWFAAVYLLLCVSLAGCILPRIAAYSRALRTPPPPPPSRLDRLSGYAASTTAENPQKALSLAAHDLRRRRWRVRTGDGWVAAEKGYLREAGNLVFHVSLLVLLAAVAAGSLFGWRGSVIVLESAAFSNTVTQYDSFTAGRMVDKANLAPFTVALDDFRATYEVGGPQSGAPRDYQADVTFTPEPGAASATKTIAVNDPLSVNGAKVFLTGHGYAPHVIVRDATGTVVFDGSVPFLPRDKMFTSMGVVKVPDTDPQLGFQAIFLPTTSVDMEKGPISVFPDSTDPGLFLSAWQGDLGLDDGTPQSVFRLDTTHMTKIGLESMKPGATWTLPDGRGTLEFAGVDEYANFAVAHDPGKEWALAAAVAAILGLLVSLFIPRRRVWVRAKSDDEGRTLVQVAGLARTENSSVGDDAAVALEAAVGGKAGGSA